MHKYNQEVTADLPLHCKCVQNDRTRGHHLKSFKHDFKHTVLIQFKRVVGMWKSLPKVVVTAPSMNTFENHLNTNWSQLMVKYASDIAYAKLNPDPANGGINMDLCQVSLR